MKNILWSLLIILVISGTSFIGGYIYYKQTNSMSPSVIRDTVRIFDTLTYYIPDTIPYYYEKLDTIFHHDTIYRQLSDSAVRSAYYDHYVFTRNWSDSNIQVKLIDEISENKFVKNDFKYTLLRPQTIIINKTEPKILNYNKYIYGGLNISKDPGVQVLFAHSKGYIGLEYSPISKTAGLNAGFIILKLK